MTGINSINSYITPVLKNQHFDSDVKPKELKPDSFETASKTAKKRNRSRSR